jgi:CheY-like chemotaxis protein
MKKALIVDDSPSARLVLGRVLTEHTLDVDTAASAEEALEYLKHHRPDVIFMDHLMPGMDGFQALEAIKDNPATATIPVMMYTSQEGELYVGQARALGAFGVLPKQLRPVEVAKVLQALHLIPSGAIAEEVVDGAVHTAEVDEGAGGGDRVRELLEELFYQQRSALREEIRHGYQRLIGRTLELNTRPPEAARGYAGPLLYLGAMLLALLAIAVGVLYYRTDARLQRTDEQLELLMAATATASAGQGAEVATSVNEIYRQDLLEVLEWGANQAPTYGFQQVALDDARGELLNVLVSRLKRVNYTGTLLFEVHAGRPCMALDAEGNAQIAPAELPLSECQQLGWPEHEAQAMGNRQTLAFANALATAGRDERVRVQTVSYGAAQPAYEYPPPTDGVTAGDWNRVAAANHRVHVRLLTD